MQYKPTNQDLLEAIAEFLRKDILSYVKENEDLAYKTLVSWNMLNVVARDIEKEEEILIKEIEEISEILDISCEIPATLKQKKEKLKELLGILCDKIQKEEIYDKNHHYWQFTKRFLIRNLSISNPRFQL